MLARSVLAALGVVAALNGSGCDAEPGPIYVQLDHYRQPCAADASAFCFRVIESDGAEPLELRSINGLAYRWGHIYDLLVEPSQTPAGEAALVEILDEEVVSDSARFELELGAAHVQRVDERQISLSDAITADCQETAICLDVARALSRGSAFTVEMAHDVRQGRFVAHHVRTVE